MSTQLVDYFVVIGASPSRKLHAYAPSATPQQNVSPSMNHHNFHRYHNGDHKKRESVVDGCDQKSRSNSNNGHNSDKFDHMMEISNILSRFSFKASILGRYPLEDDPDSPLSSEIALVSCGSSCFYFVLSFCFLAQSPKDLKTGERLIFNAPNFVYCEI